MPDYRWFHIQWGTYGSWLPGDPRGFRSREHRIYSSGDYKQPPPPGEHEGLRRYAELISRGDAIELTVAQRERALGAIVEKIGREGMIASCLSVSRMHVHLFGEFDPLVVKAEVGKLKRHSSHALGDELPGTVWSAGCHPVRIWNREHFQIVYQYILDHVREGAAVRSFWDPRAGPPPVRQMRTERLRTRRADGSG